MMTFINDYNIKQILVPEHTPSSNGISKRLNKIITGILIISKGKKIEEAVKEAEHCINTNYNRSIKSSPLYWKNGFDFYNLLKLKKKQVKYDILK